MSCRAPPPRTLFNWLPNRKGLHIPGEKTLQEPHMLCPWRKSLRWAAKPHKRVSSFQLPQDPREERSRACAVELQDPPSCYQKEKSQSPQEKSISFGLSLPGAGHHQSVLTMLGKARLTGTKHAPQWVPSLCNLFNFSHLAKYHNNTIHVPKGLPEVAYKNYNEN